MKLEFEINWILSSMYHILCLQVGLIAEFFGHPWLHSCVQKLSSALWYPLAAILIVNFSFILGSVHNGHSGPSLTIDHIFQSIYLSTQSCKNLDSLEIKFFKGLKTNKCRGRYQMKITQNAALSYNSFERQDWQKRKRKRENF